MGAWRLGACLRCPRERDMHRIFMRPCICTAAEYENCRMGSPSGGVIDMGQESSLNHHIWRHERGFQGWSAVQPCCLAWAVAEGALGPSAAIGQGMEIVFLLALASCLPIAI
jgi:hypothetical protein